MGQYFNNKLLKRLIRISFITSVAATFVFAKENIAVLDFKAINVSAADAVAISEFVGIALLKTEKFNVLERSSIDKVMAEQGFQQTGCTTEECAVQVGKILNIRKAIIGSYTKISGLYFITAKVVNIETSKIIKSEKVKFKDINEIDSSIDELVSLITGERVKQKLPKSEHIGNFGIGFHNLGGSLRYFAGVTTLEAKFVYGDDFSAFGPRLYLNLNPNSNTVIYIGGEYCQIEGESEIEKFTGTATGAFIGLELFINNKFSFLLDMGPYTITLDSEFDSSNVLNSYIIGHISVNIYF